MAEQLWKGRFSKAVDSRVNDFNSSIRFDQRMIAQDMRGSGVHAAMLAKQGIISEKDCEDILNGLASIADDLAAGRLEIDPGAEDVHTFVEQTLTARIGDAGKRLHTGRSRNDQVALDIRLTLRDYSHTLQAYIVELIKVICKKAGENTTAVMPGYTHLQRAQPITFGHALMAYASMLLRDLQRFEDATARMDSQCPLGSGALAGTTYPLDRQFTAEKLGFAAPCANSLDGVSDRDFCIELANAISICMMHLSRAFRGDHPLVQLGVQVHRAGRRLYDGLVHHAAEEEPGCYRADPRQDRPRLRRPEHPAGDDEGHSPRLQQGHAGG